ncbi:MAG: hypothetical protein H6Q65_2152 [Firmicutes bacterium]|nr:hypothetical protein [Bacillota bacterium]
MMEEREELLEQIEADSVTIEVIDKNTGKKFQRSLPIQYFENCNGIIISGETLDGKLSQIHFLSETALCRINELVGKGADRPRCNDH